MIWGASAAWGQFLPTCQVAANLPLLHAEGLTEQIGDVTLTCTGGTANSNVLTYLSLALNATITNETDQNGNLLGITTTVSINGGSPTNSGLQPTLDGAADLVVNGMSYNVPATPSTPVVLRISGVRVAVPTATNSSGGAATSITGSLGGAGAVIQNGQSLELGLPFPTLLNSSEINGIPCAGSPLPTTTPLTFQSFISNNSSSSAIRLTEATQASFVARNTTDPTVTNGMRFIVSLSGYGAGTSVYLPNAIVGSTGLSPTSGGEYGTTISSGTYSPGQSQLLLALVNGADSTGAGGTLSFTIPGSTTTFSAVTQIPLTNGSGYAVYEVLDSNLSRVEWAQIPVFLVAPANACSTSGDVALTAMLGPVSTDAQPSATDPVPRYVATAAGNDCSAIGDCSASYFPKLQVAPASGGVTLTGSALGQTVLGFISVTDGGQSQLTFTATITYQTASGLTVANWLSVDGSTSSITGSIDPVNGSSTLQLNLIANTQLLSVPGTYKATVTINAGQAGTVAVPVTFNVGPAGPVIQALVNSANFTPGAVTLNEFVTLFGLNLAKKNTLTVTFDGFPGTVSYDSPAGSANPTQINVLVPVGLALSQNAGVIATVDGVASNTFPINLTPNAPAVFTPGILNQDNSVNLSGSPEVLGDVVQVFLTGLAIPLTGPVTVDIGDMNGLIPTYSGPVVSIPGLEQVNVLVPANLTFSGGSAPLSICIPGANGTSICSVPVNLYLQ